MKKEIALYVTECDTCKRVKTDHLKLTGPIQPLDIPEWKWDFIVGLPMTQHKHDSIRVIVDRPSPPISFQ